MKPGNHRPHTVPHLGGARLHAEGSLEEGLTVLKHVPAHAPVLQHALRGAGGPQRRQAHVSQGDVPAAAAAAVTGAAGGVVAG